MDKPDTRDSLILAIRDPENREAWDEFSRLYRPVVYRLARVRGMQDADAEDLTQQVLISVARAVDGWRRTAGGGFRGWLRCIARNAIVNALTRQRSPPAVGGSDFLTSLKGVADSELPLEEQIETEFQRQLFRRAAEIVRASVREETWLMFERTVVEGQSCVSVARQSGRSLGSVHAARSRIMRRLQVVVNELLEADQ